MSDSMTGSVVLVAGATGAVGTVLVPRLRSAGARVIPHVRPKTAERHPLGKDADGLVCDLDDAAKLDAAMAQVTSIACLVGTMRRRFAQGDSYESSDYLPVVRLVESAKRVSSLQPRHFVLLSALGARKGPGYPGWKFRAEEAVRESGLPWCILRPSFFDSRGAGAQPSDGTERKPPPLLSGAFAALGAIPGLRGVADDLRAMPLEVLATALVHVLAAGAPRASILTGRQIWQAAQPH